MTDEDAVEDDDKKRFTVHLDNLDRDDDVLVTVSGEGALAWAKNDQSIDGSSWEGSDGPDFAYAVISDRPSLVEELEAEGYDLNLDEYFEPEDA